jgi:hypothetical protein
MNWFGDIFVGFWILYCGTFCSMALYSAIIEEWCCKNRIPEWRERIIHHIRPSYNIVIDQENIIV